MARRGVVALLSALLVLAAAALAAPVANAQSNPFQTRGMWIWVLSKSNSGSLASIASQSHRNGIRTLYIKSSDGSGMWSQFSSDVVQTFHSQGIRVCAWQFVYGNHPNLEAQAGANAVHRGADCLVIDAEGQYEHKYASAHTYITRLRQAIGAGFPVALAGFPYIDYHPAFPYSVFLGPGGAQYSIPQMYWRDIGTSVDTVFSHTYFYNRLYQRPIYPLGQVYNSPPAKQLVRFRQFLGIYGAGGVSWWDWQEARGYTWPAISKRVSQLTNVAALAGEASIHKGSAGDLVIWAQEHLLAAGENVGVDGGYGARTVAAVKDFQSIHGLYPDGTIGPQTWSALLRYQPMSINWGHTSRKTSNVSRLAAAGRLTQAAVAAADTAEASSAGGGVRPAPASSLLPARGNELGGSPGAGSPNGSANAQHH
jgi:Putative peptidoglycan binding domain